MVVFLSTTEDKNSMIGDHYMPDIHVFDFPVHPAADVFPMLDDDELAELANDIAENGLHHPLVVTGLNGSTVLVDGRNRRAACKLVNVTPEVTQLEGDAIAYILSANINRRHLTKGQRAMAVARICPETGHSVRKASVVANVSKSRVSLAHVVLRYAPDLAAAVLSGSTSLDEAYRRAQEAKALSESRDAVFVDLKAARALRGTPRAWLVRRQNSPALEKKSPGREHRGCVRLIPARPAPHRSAVALRGAG